MENQIKVFRVAILGCGARGAESYGRLFYQAKEKYEIVSLCDTNQEKLVKYRDIFNVKEENCFLTEEEFFAEKRADLLVIATLDKDHVRQCIKGMERGYDILMEKPITDNYEECLQLLETQKKYGCKVLVCHVLRYAPAFMKVKELLEKNTIGRLVAIQAIEQVAWWHQAHSYVRGNWRKEKDTTPMILAKCCHDLDLLQWYAGSSCKSISSVGDLTFFNKDNAPQDCATRCSKCKYFDTCAYSAKKIYIDKFIAEGRLENDWPVNVLTPVIPITEEVLMEAIKEGPYGRCVFHCDNDVVDHQITQITFENGVKASLTMTAFTADVGRIMKFYGTQGEIDFDEAQERIDVKLFTKKAESIHVNLLEEGGYGHGGGDYGIITTLYDILTGTEKEETSLS
ncbi:MAG: Gfo/Idh/MocA family oxidoreductase, partial [Clostridia bacterium]|nr:Gfo/Idh/MocA family oxidoreductase [Clostridia bacterium]